MKHKHAELIALYARDAAETETPWERWEWRRHDGEWMPFNLSGPKWDAMTEYRRKPDDLSEAVALATAIRNRCYPEETDWKPLDTVSGVLSQISNMVEGMMRKGERVKELEVLLKEAREIAATRVRVAQECKAAYERVCRAKEWHPSLSPEVFKRVIADLP